MQHLYRWFIGMVCGLSGTLAAAAAPTEITLVRGDEDYPPFEMVVGHKLRGVHVEMVEAAARSMGLRVKWQSLPWKRALRMVELGQVDGVTYIGRTPEREAWAIFDEDNQLSSTDIRFIVLRANAANMPFDGNLVSYLANRTPIVVRGFQFGIADIDRRKKFEANNMADVVRQLEAKVGGVGVVNWSDFSGAFADKPEMEAVTALKPAITTTYNYIAFSKARKHEALAHQFGNALASYKRSAAYTELLSRYRTER
ncbi:substrate-binding periplasmic protein [Rhodoferax aquaticus]|nr:transporter substrate-binding domain-containing protein [Rhodoferax aquaticus]